MPKLEIVPIGALTPSMRMLKERHGFDTLAARQACVDLARLPPSSHVLDVGAGSGWMAIVLAAAEHQVVAVDLDGEALIEGQRLAAEFGAKIVDRIKFVVADATALPFEAELFDGVFSFESLHHFVDCARAVDEMHRVCRPGGAISVADLNLDGLRAVRDTMQMLTGRSHEENPCHLPELERLLSQFNQVTREDLPFMSVFTVRRNDANGDRS